MPLPVAAVAVAIVVGLVGGGAAAADGGVKMKKAKHIGRDAAARHAEGLAEFRVIEARVQVRAGVYGRRQLRIQSVTLGAWVDWLEAKKKKVRRFK